MKQQSRRYYLAHIVPGFGGFMRAAGVLMLFFCLFSPAVQAASVEAVVHQARTLKLAEHPGWHALLHYKREALLPRTLSQADDARFFLSAQGKTDARAELEAGIRAFLSEQGGDAQCRFPARWHWLKQQLKLSDQYDIECPALTRWLDAIPGDSLTMVFPVMYLNNPASMFGHTFLRFDHPDSIVLSHTLNYAADIDEDEPFVSYIFNGLFGGFNGVFGSRPYYETIETYSNLQNRDIWEYRLNLTPAEIRQLLRHIWEIRDIRFDYYFLRENCSYRLLALFDVLRPEAHLTSGHAFKWYAIPVDTVRALDTAGIVAERHYRPSLASRLQVGFARMDSGSSQRVQQLAEGDLEADAMEKIDVIQRSELLEQTYTLLQFRGQADSERAQRLLVARSRLNVDVDETRYNAAPPETGHASMRFAVGAGEREQRPFAALQLRPGFHDLVDAPDGYIDGAEINVLDTELRWYRDNETVRIESLQIINIISLSPLQSWYKPVSWQLGAGFERFNYLADDDMVFVTDAGAGVSTRQGPFTLFAMAALELDASQRFAKGYTLLSGVRLGALLHFGFGQWKLSAQSGEPVSGFELDRDTVTSELQFNFTTNTALRLGYKKVRYDNVDDTDWSVAFNYYF